MTKPCATNAGDELQRQGAERSLRFGRRLAHEHWLQKRKPALAGSLVFEYCLIREEGMGMGPACNSAKESVDSLWADNINGKNCCYLETVAADSENSGENCRYYYENTRIGSDISY